MDPISLLAGGVLVLVGMALGHLGRRRARPKPVEPICGCRHHLAKHDPETGECHDTDTRYEFDLAAGAAVLKAHRCPCRQYVGPVPIAQLWTPPVLPDLPTDTP